MPHAHPAENLSVKAMRRCRESRWRRSEAKLDAVYAHSVHVKRGALCAYADRTEAGRALAADGLSAGSTSMGTAAVVAEFSATPADITLSALSGVQSSIRGQGPVEKASSLPQGSGAAYPSRSGCMRAGPPSWSSWVSGTQTETETDAAVNTAA
ncbi:unnamed protein product [Peronospora destructor]|uniref:Uncharacterized protein n=1 Tax=Peronospora destructor TaxID=86335 RepID=A0AAV0UBE6_9STRA|nr:unnamed protein product [Peronospora destructor]